MSNFGQPPGGQGGGGFGQPPGGGQGGGGFGQPPGGQGGGGFGQPPGGGQGGGGGFGQPPGGGGFGQPSGGGFGDQGSGGGFGNQGGGGSFGAPPPAGGPGGEKTEVLAIVSTVTGALGLISCCCICFAPLPIAAIVTGALGLSKVNKEPGLKGKELCYVGIGLGAFSLLLTIASLIYNLATGGGVQPEYWEQF